MNGNTAVKLTEGGGKKLGRELNECRKNLIKCETHNDQRLENFCVDHACVCCYECLVSAHAQCSIQLLDEIPVNLNETELEQICSSLNDINYQVTLVVGNMIAGIKSFQRLEVDSAGIGNENAKAIPISEENVIMKKRLKNLSFLSRELQDRLSVTGQAFKYCVTHRNDLISLVTYLKSKHALEEMSQNLSLFTHKTFKDMFNGETNNFLLKIKKPSDEVNNLTESYIRTLNKTQSKVEKRTVVKLRTERSQKHQKENISSNSVAKATSMCTNTSEIAAKDYCTHISKTENQLVQKCRPTADKPLDEIKEQEQKNFNYSTKLSKTEYERDDGTLCRKENEYISYTVVNSISTENIERITPRGFLDSKNEFEVDEVGPDPQEFNIIQKINIEDPTCLYLALNDGDAQHNQSGINDIYSSSFAKSDRLSIIRSLTQDIVLSTNTVLSKKSNPPGQYRQAIQVQCNLKLEELNQRTVALSNDVFPCNIYDVVCMPDGKIVVTDVNNSCLKLFDVYRDNAKYLYTKYPPYSLVCISNSLLMFVCGHARNRLNLVSVTSGLEVRQEFSTNHACIALATNNSFIYVLCENNFRTECHILNTEGVVNMKIDIGRHVKFPQFIAVDPISERVYITDNNGVYSFDRSGHKITHCQDKAISRYKGVTVDSSGNVFLCTCFPDGVYAMPRTKNYLQPQLLGQELQQVHAICYSARDNSIFVSFSDSDYIRQYRIISD